MRPILKFLGIFFKSKHSTSNLPAVPLASEWTDEDRTRLLQFLRNPTGEKFILRARAVESKNAIAACQDSVTTTHSAARAAGFSDAVKWMLSLSISSSEPDVIGSESEAADGETRNLEHDLAIT